MLAPKSNLLLAVEELHLVKQGSGELHAHINYIVKRCKFSNAQDE